MVYKKLSEENKIIIKYLRQKFGYGAKRIIKDHPEKNWGLRNVGYLLKKIDQTGDVKRREGSGRPKSSRTENNINLLFLLSLFLTQLQLQQNELKLNTQNAQSREKKFKVSHQINPVAEAYRETAKGP